MAKKKKKEKKDITEAMMITPTVKPVQVPPTPLITAEEILGMGPGTNFRELLARRMGIWQEAPTGQKAKELQSLYSKGVNLYIKGDLKKAESAWKGVLKIWPFHQKARMNIQKVKRRTAL